jgi:transcriptional regulator with XRE-family HTH domain
MNEYNVGNKLKILRLAKKLTLRYVADEIGYSPALISQIEHNNVSPPIPTLAKLASFYGVRMSSLFAESDEDIKFEVIRRDERKIISKIVSRAGSSHTYLYESLAFKKQSRKIEVFVVTFSGKIKASNTYSHGGESFLYVVDGSVVLVQENGRIILNEGDSAYFDASLEHRFCPKEGSGGTILQVFFQE